MKVTTGFTHIFIFSCSSVRGGSWAAATSKMERFVKALDPRLSVSIETVETTEIFMIYQFSKVILIVIAFICEKYLMQI